MRLTAFILTLTLLGCTSSTSNIDQNVTLIPKVRIVIHGGAGTIKKENMTDEMETAYRDKLKEALSAGYEVLDKGGESCDAVMKAINIMENSPLFNAGIGAVMTAENENELDASIMRGRDLEAGAVAGVKTIKNPILAAYEVMVNSPHVMMAGSGADQFAMEQGIETVDPEYFKTDRRMEQLRRIQARIEKEFGTVGAVALDDQGNICAGTSTGGMSNKRWGRIGDSPVIGAGTYANNATCGVSSTGHGEYFIRGVAAYDLSALMEYKGYEVDRAGWEVINKLDAMGGKGGLIALDAKGNVSMPFSTSGMYRGYVTDDGEVVVKVYKNE